jgi:replicative DNA helicase
LVGLDKDEPKGQPKSIWASAQKGRKGPALAPEMIEGCAKTWEWKRLKSSVPAGATVTPSPDRLEVQPFAHVVEEGITAASLKAAIEEYCAEENVFQRAILEVQIGAKFKVRGQRFSELCADVLSPNPSEAQRIADLVPGYFEAISHGIDHRNRGYLTGLPRVDAILKGLSTQTNVVIAGRPGMGKTTLTQGVVRQFVENYKQGAAIFSLEMDKESLLDKFVSAETNIPYERLRVRNLSDSELLAASDSLARIMGWPLVIDDSAELHIESLKRKAYKIAKDFESDGISLKCIAVDHIGLIKGPKSDSKALEISAISKALLAIGKELGCVVLVLSQLNRGVEGRADKRPMASDLKESGSLEEDASQVLLLYRDEYYNKSSPDRGIAEIIVAKNRHGPTGTGKALFDGAYSRFSPLEATP